ncbi:MAG: response regulator [Alphaproteobacteria bacterium]|nr:response regulator [Alphaproteobacteria bacterium]
MTKKDNTNQSRTRVVVADDDPIIRELFESKLQQMDCEPLLAEDGAEAWKVLRSAKRVDLAIVDLDMPNVDGFSLIQCVRGHPRTKHLPIVVVTSRTDTKAIQEAFAAGATSFLTKPLHWSTFNAHIEYLMRLTQSAQQARMQAQRSQAAIRIKDLVLRRTLEAGTQGTAQIQSSLERLVAALESGTDIDDIAAHISSIGDQATRIEGVLAQAQNLTRALCSQVSVRDTRVPLINILANAQTRLSEAARGRNVPVSVVRTPSDAYIACDPEGLSLAVSHLIDNAVRYSPEGSNVTLEADVHPDGMLTLVVNDEGPGMEPDFYAARLHPNNEEERADQEKSEGVGLALVKAIAEAHGGALEIRSMPNEGTSAMLVLPADRVYVEDVDAA